MGDQGDASAVDVVQEHAAGRIDRREAVRRLGGFGIVGAAAFSLLGAADSRAARGKPFRILAFCGGGIRGIASAGMLRRLANRSPNVVSKADLLAGTSIGSTIVSGLLANESPNLIHDTLVTTAPVFYNHPNTNPERPAFDISKLAAAQRALHTGNPPLRTFRKKAVFTTFNVGSVGTGWQPLLLNNLSKSTNANTGIVDAVVSSAAMPGELGSYKGHIDGAFVNHDPTLVAIALAINEGVRLEDIVVICFGTGFMKNWIASGTSKWGAKQWQNGDGNPRNRTPTPVVNGTISPVLGAALDGPSTNLTPQLATMMLGKRYVYLNPNLDRIIPEDDIDPDDLAYLEAQAAKVNISRAVSLVRKYWS